jgi:hypothetical protein
MKPTASLFVLILLSTHVVGGALVPLPPLPPGSVVKSSLIAAPTTNVAWNVCTVTWSNCPATLNIPNVCTAILHSPIVTGPYVQFWIEPVALSGAATDEFTNATMFYRAENLVTNLGD